MHFYSKVKLRSNNKKSVKYCNQIKFKNNYLKEIKNIKKSIPNWNNLFSDNITDEDRLQQWIRLRIFGNSLMSKYSWAIPDDNSLNIIKEFSPLIELGAGNGYWSW